MSSNITELQPPFPWLEGMKSPPLKLYAIGNLALLEKPKIAIVGSRKATMYAKQQTFRIAQELARAGICIVSGGAMGIDAEAHRGAGVERTIMVAGTGLHIRYPAINHSLIEAIEKQGLVLSQFAATEPSLKWNFPLRNALIVALADALIVTHAEQNSGTMHSVRYALDMGKKVYVLPHRLGESHGTTALLKEGRAEALYDTDALIACYGKIPVSYSPFEEYCLQSPVYEEALKVYATELFEYECAGKITIENGRIRWCGR